MAPQHDQIVVGQPTRHVQLEPAQLQDKGVIRQLLEFNAYEFSRFDGADLDAHGTFGYRFLDHYWTEPDRHPFLIMVDARVAGTALVRAGPPHSMAEFWRKAIPAPFSEAHDDQGTTQRFVSIV